MERLTKRITGHAHGAEGVSVDKLTGAYCRGEFEATACVDKLAEYEDAEENGLLIKRNKDDEVYLRVIACEVMEHQKNYAEDVYHMFSKGVQAFLVAIEKALAEMG